MALGDVTILTPDASAVEILAAAAAANGAPTGTAGVAMQDIRSLFGGLAKKLRLITLSTAGSGTMTATMRLWIRLGAIGWVVVHAMDHAADPFTAVAIAETGTDTIGYSELVEGLEAADRVYVEIVAIAGTSTAVKALLVASRPN